MIALNDYQLALIMDLATPLTCEQRSAFLEAVAARLKGRQIGDGTLYRTALEVQRQRLIMAPYDHPRTSTLLLAAPRHFSRRGS